MFLIFKDKETGVHRWVGMSSNNARDRDGEIVSAKSLEATCERATKVGDFGPLRWWHVKGLDIGTTDYAEVREGMLVEGGTIPDPRIATYLKENAASLGLSIGFSHAADQPDAAGVFHNITIKERSVLPIESAANPWTSFSVKEKGKQGAPVEKKWRVFVDKCFGGDEAAAKAYTEHIAARSKQLDDQRIDRKEASEKGALSAEQLASPGYKKIANQMNAGRHESMARELLQQSNGATSIWNRLIDGDEYAATCAEPARARTLVLEAYDSLYSAAKGLTAAARIGPAVEKESSEKAERGSAAASVESADHFFVKGLSLLSQAMGAIGTGKAELSQAVQRDGSAASSAHPLINAAQSLSAEGDRFRAAYSQGMRALAGKYELKEASGEKAGLPIGIDRNSSGLKNGSVMFNFADDLVSNISPAEIAVTRLSVLAERLLSAVATSSSGLPGSHPIFGAARDIVDGAHDADRAIGNMQQTAHVLMGMVRDAINKKKESDAPVALMDSNARSADVDPITKLLGGK